MRLRFIAALVLLAACAPNGGEAQLCTAVQRTGVLPAELRESSGVVRSLGRPGVLWSHNDSGYDPLLFAIDSTGRVLGRVRVTGARNVDWEDVALGPCNGGHCLYIGDIGDNTAVRDRIVVYRVPEPAPDDDATAEAVPFPARYPDGAQDAEALFVLPAERIHLITKGRTGAIAVYRYPAPLRPGEEVVLERVQEAAPGPAPLGNQVTGAAATPDGRWVAVRTYTYLALHRVRDGRLEPAHETPIDLTRLGEPQGEGVDIAADGTLIFTSEIGPLGAPAPASRMSCTLPR